MFSTIVDYFTLFVSTYFALTTIKKIGLSSRYIIYYFFFIIMVIPLYLDYIVGKPVYTAWLLGSKNYGFILSYDDGLSRFMYDIFILLFQSIILFFKVDKEQEYFFASQKKMSVINLTDKTKKGIFGLFVFLSIIPVLLTIILPISNKILYSWGWRELGLYDAENSPYYYHLEKLSYIGCASALLLLLTPVKDFNISGGKRRLILKKIKPLWIFLTYLNICIESKRSILIFCMAIIVTFLIDYIPREKMFFVLLFSFLALFIVVILGVFVKITFRSYSEIDALYTALRIDYFRDDTMKMLIYSLFHPNEIQVLEYPFQSYLMQIGYIFPLDLLGTPRIGYNRFFTCALLNQPLSSGASYTTTSMYDELVANFGLFGFIIAPIFSVWVAKIADKYSSIVKTMIIAGYVLLVMYSLNYIMWFLQIVVLILFISKFKLKFGDRYLF